MPVRYLSSPWVEPSSRGLGTAGYIGMCSIFPAATRAAPQTYLVLCDEIPERHAHRHAASRCE